MKIQINESPIFIVGAPRSGTTLLAAMLAAHSRISCGPETRFFRFLAKNDPRQLLESWPENALDYLFTMKLIDSVPAHYDLSREQLHSYLKDRPPDVAAILSSLTKKFMLKTGKVRWVEKSPEHLMYVQEIRKYFPYSPVIRIIRDPRDVALSMNKTPWAPQDFLEALLFWCRYDDLSQAFFQYDNNCYTLYYEDLAQSPETILMQVCAFIGEKYEEQMLSTAQSATSLVTDKETWKHRAYQPVDSSRIHVWKRCLTSGQNRQAEALVGDRLIAYGYEGSDNFDHYARVYPSVDLLMKYRKTLESFVEAGARFWQRGHKEKPKILIYVGEPDRDKWLRIQKPERWWDTISIVLRILTSKLGDRPVYWVQDRGASTNSGICSRVLAIVFQHAGEQCYT